MASSDGDDSPLVKSRRKGVKSKERVSSSSKRAMDKQPSTNGHVEPGVSIRMGPVDAVPKGKRKSRGSGTNGAYRAAIPSDDEKPLSKRRRTTATINASSDTEMRDAPPASGSRRAAKAAPKKRTTPPTSSSSESGSELSDVPLAITRKPTAASAKRTTPPESSSEQGDVPLVKTKKPPKAKAAQIGKSSDSDTPLSTKLVKQKVAIEKAAEKEAKSIRSKESKAKRASNGVKKTESDSERPAKKPSIKPKSETPTPAKKTKGKAAKEEMEQEADAEEDDDEYRWWEDPTKGDGTKKWTTLEHNGVVFPPEYVALPSHVKLLYDGTPVNLEKEAEEVATFYGTMLHSAVNVENPTFNKNFFADFTKVLDKTGHGRDKEGKRVKIKKFENCDFKPMFAWFEAERSRKRALPAAEKKALKAEKDAAEAPFMHCMWDGRKQKVGNFRVEPPGLFRGRGEHPKTGMVKKRVMPEQVTINIGAEAKVPEPPAGHRWKEVKHDKEGTWLAMWQENINNAHKYVMLAANSDVKGQSDYKKFEKARELKKHIDRIRADYRKELKSEVMAERQRATALYLIDEFALRAGNEKGEDEAETVGCCSLKFQHVTLKPPTTVIFDFLGKDSIRFYDEVKVDRQVWKNLRIFRKEPKSHDDLIFDRLTTSSLNKHLTNYMAGLTAKVFRTYNASWTFARLLKDLKTSGTVAEKVKDYNDANREVAILCNHKRTVAASHAGSMEKMEDKINGLRYQMWRTKQMMLDVEPKTKKKKGAEYFALPEQLDEAWVQQHQAALVEEQRQKITKKFEKENEKLAAEGSKEMKSKELTERMEAAEELAAKFAKENKTGKVEAEGRGPTVEKLETAVQKLEQRIETARVQMEDKDNNKEVALGTSKINYIDPRLTVVFSKKFDVPIERFFSKTLREKFDWAIKSVDENWEF